VYKTLVLGPQRKEFFRHYKFDVAPTTDDRPYFFDFFKWQALPELLERRTLGGAALLDWGYAVLVATLVQASVLALVLILTPLLWLGRQGKPLPLLSRDGESLCISLRSASPFSLSRSPRSSVSCCFSVTPCMRSQSCCVHFFFLLASAAASHRD
jgi:hypothetical protein